MNPTPDSPRRLLLKVSGEGFSRDGETGLDTERVKVLAEQLRHLTSNGVQVACVIGGGNILRGAQFKEKNVSIHEATAHYMGMLATVIQHENDHLDGKLITDYATPADLLKYDKALKLMKSNNVR
mgnify:CR=1 FL=1